MSDYHTKENNRYLGIGLAMMATLGLGFLAILFASPLIGLGALATGASAVLLINHKNK